MEWIDLGSSLRPCISKLWRVETYYGETNCKENRPSIMRSFAKSMQEEILCDRIQVSLPWHPEEQICQSTAM